MGNQLADDFFVGRVAPLGRIDAHIGKDHLRAACRGGCVPDFHDVIDEPIDFRAREVMGRGREHPGIGGEFSSVGGDGKCVVHPWVHLLRPQSFRSVPPNSCWDCLLPRRHRAGDDDQHCPPCRAGTRKIEHLNQVCTSENAPEHLLGSGRLVNLATKLIAAVRFCASGNFHRVHDFAERRCPCVEMFQPTAGQVPRGRGIACMVYISTMVLEIGVPVANVTP